MADDMAKIPGMTTAMMVALGENKILTVEDFADCATDDLLGWTERKKDKETEAVRHKGILAGFELDKAVVEDMIMQARVIAGWITQADLDKAKADAEAAAAAAAEAAANPDPNAAAPAAAKV